MTEVEVPNVRVVRVHSVGAGPRSWGEGWWTAADLTLTHPRSPLQEDLRAQELRGQVAYAFEDALSQQLWEQFVYGNGSSGVRSL